MRLDMANYMGAYPNSYYNVFVKMVEYHIDTLPILQDIIDASVQKVKYGGWMRIWINKNEQPVNGRENMKPF